MATQNKIIEMMATVKTIYPYYAKDTDVEALVKTWGVLLRDYPDEVIDAAFYKCLQKCKMPPTPADVIEQIAALKQAAEPSTEELWSIYIKALHDTAAETYKFAFTYVDSSGLSQGEQARRKVGEIWNGLPDKLKKYLATQGELIRTSRMESDEIRYERSRFEKAMKTISARAEYENLLMLDAEKNLFALCGDQMPKITN